jgi:hypothetical protein
MTARCRKLGGRGTAGQRDKPPQVLVAAGFRLSRQLSPALQFVPAGAGCVRPSRPDAGFDDSLAMVFSGFYEVDRAQCRRRPVGFSRRGNGDREATAVGADAVGHCAILENAPFLPSPVILSTALRLYQARDSSKGAAERGRAASATSRATAGHAAWPGRGCRSTR